jgi:uncharacterized protein DUF6379
MFEKYMICESGFRNVSDQSQIKGFQIQVRIGYYRGMPLSSVEDYAVTVDGQAVPRDQVRFSVGGRTFTLDEMESKPDFRWQFDEIATVIVRKPGGLMPGMHEIEVTQKLRIPYTETRDIATARKKITLVS